MHWVRRVAACAAKGLAVAAVGTTSYAAYISSFLGIGGAAFGGAVYTLRGVLSPPPKKTEYELWLESVGVFFEKVFAIVAVGVTLGVCVVID